MDQHFGRRLRRLAATALVGVLLTAGSLTSASAITIRVSQESTPGAGDFDANVLGNIDPFVTGLTIAGFYQYNVPNVASYNGELNGGPLPLSSVTRSFFVEASDGLHYAVVHDNPNDGSGGSTRMTTVLIGGAGGAAAFSVEDDPGEGTSVSDVAGDRIFDTVHNWAPCCTDGYAIGSLLGDPMLLAAFDAVPVGIDTWQATGSGGLDLALALEEGRRVRFDVAGVPEPGMFALLGVGLVVMGISRRTRSADA